MLSTSLFRSCLPADVSAVAIGVSGGADSFALLHLAHLWAQENQIALTALTVNHGLRSESAEEANSVAKWCAQNNILHHILHWQGDKPKTGLQEAARDKRRELLCSFCQQNDIPVLWMAHQADDQAETMIMRLQKGSGLHGLTCIPAITTDQPTQVQIIRPLLKVRRQELRNYCTYHKLPFIDDPSNENTDFERVRIRRLMTELPDFAAGVITSIERLRQADEELTQRAHAWQQINCHPLEGAQTWLPREEFNVQSRALRVRILGHFFDDQYPKLSGVENIITALENDAFTGTTLDGIWLRPKTLNKTKGWIIQQAPARKTG